MAAPFSIQLRVRYTECDMQGHVFNGHYLTWFDMAHTEMMAKALGRPWSETLETGIDVVVIESGIRYRSPAHFEDELTIAMSVEPLTQSSMTTRFEVRRHQTLIAEGFLRHVCVTHGTLDKLPWPDDVRQALSPFVSSARPAAEAGETAAH